MLNAFVWGVSWWPFRELHGRGLHPLWATALIYALLLAGAWVAAWGFVTRVYQFLRLLARLLGAAHQQLLGGRNLLNLGHRDAE